MRKIKIESWKVKTPVLDKNNKPTGETKEQDENLLVVVNALLSSKKPEEMPRGIKEFQIMGRIANAFETADKTGDLVLEESDYGFIKETIEKDIPAAWGFNENISKAVSEFLDATENKEEK